MLILDTYLTPTKELALLLFGTITTFTTVYNFRTSRVRNKLKDDFEILKKYKEAFGNTDDPCYESLSNKLKRRMDKQYNRERFDFSDIFWGLTFIIAALLSLVNIENAVYKFVISGLCFIMGVCFAYLGVRDYGKKRV